MAEFTDVTRRGFLRNVAAAAAGTVIACAVPALPAPARPFEAASKSPAAFDVEASGGFCAPAQPDFSFYEVRDRHQWPGTYSITWPGGETVGPVPYDQLPWT